MSRVLRDHPRSHGAKRICVCGYTATWLYILSFIDICLEPHGSPHYFGYWLVLNSSFYYRTVRCQVMMNFRSVGFTSQSILYDGLQLTALYCTHGSATEMELCHITQRFLVVNGNIEMHKNQTQSPQNFLTKIKLLFKIIDLIQIWSRPTYAFKLQLRHLYLHQIRLCFALASMLVRWAVEKMTQNALL